MLFLLSSVWLTYLLSITDGKCAEQGWVILWWVVSFFPSGFWKEFVGFLCLLNYVKFIYKFIKWQETFVTRFQGPSDVNLLLLLYRGWLVLFCTSQLRSFVRKATVAVIRMQNAYKPMWKSTVHVRRDTREMAIPAWLSTLVLTDSMVDVMNMLSVQWQGQ